MIQEAAQGCGRFDRCIGWQRLPHRRQEKIEQHLDVVQMLLARQCRKNVSVKLSSTSFLCVHTLILRCKAVLDSFFVNRNISDALVGAGGDGTVSSLAYAARTAQKPYLPYPAGTANLIAQNLKLPTKPRELADVFLAGRTLTLDLAELDVAGQTHGFAMLAGLGIDAAMIRDSEEEKSSMGAGAYVASALKQLRPETAHFTVTLDDRELQVEGMGVMVANFGMANFRMPITGDVSPADGKLSVIVLKGTSIAALIPSLIGSVRAKLNLGDPDLGDALETYESSEVRVSPAATYPPSTTAKPCPMKSAALRRGHCQGPCATSPERAWKNSRPD